MSIEIKVPALPESVTEATVAEWHKAEGEAVTRDDNLADLETDKVVLEVPAIESGTLLKIVAKAGASVVAGDVLAILEAGETKQTATAKTAAAAPATAEPAQDVQQSPAVRRLLEEHGLSAQGIPASGKGGRLTKADVEASLKQQEAPAAKAAASAAPAATEPAVSPMVPTVAGNERIEQRVPMTRIRARIAERLIEAQQNAAMLTTFNEVDLYAVDKLRKQYRDVFEKNHKVRLGYMSFFVRAVIEALKRFPIVNASVDGQDIVYHGYYDIGIAVSSPRGLVVPILRDADKLSFSEVESSIGEFGARAKANKLTMDDLLGGTFSITNGGVFGSMLSTPILNPPQSAILGMH
ncbi:MAG: 2-oxoglutarate dehydrogenase complex dihydrolipoyllysine-residue succinyltransferase, partial [Oceanococcus sp.]